MPSGAQPTSKNPLLLLPLAALLAILPLLLHGCSCGHDLVFHVQSWLDAAQQLRHGTLYPRWAFTPAWNAGEPRLLFYPPLSWMLGAILTILFPVAATPTIFIFIALLASGLTFYKLASHFVSPDAALLAAALYLANPYMLFNAFERSALAELLAAAWIPLLFLAVLRTRPTVRAIAIPIALLWLTNAPAAVMGCYTFALLATLRVLHALRTRNLQAKSLALTCIAGTALGLALPAFYLLPAAYERRFIQVAMAIIPNMRYQDNFLFTSTADAAHNVVNHTASTLALTLLVLTIATVLTLLLLRKRIAHFLAPVLAALAALTVFIAFLLFSLSAPLWEHLPELAFLQFPWRLLTILSAVLALALALLFDAFTHPPTIQLPQAPRKIQLPPSARVLPPFAQNLAALLLPLALGLFTFHLYAQPCGPDDRPATIAQHLATHHGVAPTDEYTPSNADNDVLRTDNPGYWLSASANPNTPAPNTLPTATELNPNIDTDDNPIPLDQTISAHAPTHLTLNLPQPEILILNLRAYPNWDVTGVGPDTMSIEHYPSPARDDGLITMQLPRGQRTIDIAWRRTPDQQLGIALSALALIALALTFRRTQT